MSPGRERVRGVAEFLGPLLVLLLIWEAVARAGIVNPILLPPASKVIVYILHYLMPSGNFLLEKHIELSLYRLGAGFLIAAVAGVILGTAMGMFRLVYKFFAPILSILMPIPSIAWVPIVILWLGLGNATPIFIVFFTAIFPILYNTSTGVRSIDHRHIWAARTMGASNIQIFFSVVLPGALVYTIIGLKIGLASGWRALVAAEMLSATAFGLGFMIFEAKEFLQVEIMYAGIVCLAVLGFILENGIFGPIEEKTLKRWGVIKDVN